MANVVSLREKILQAKDLQEQLVDIPEWGVKVLVKGLTGAQRARLASATGPGGKPDFEKIYLETVILATYDPETGERIFSPSDRDALGEKSGAALDHIAQVALRLSGMAPEALAEAEKN